MGKWVEVEDIERPAAELAAEILESRLQVVRQMLPLAAHSYRDDVEHVHQLRVGCRRAGAALESFHPLLKGKAKRLRKWLKILRKSAGPARDFDVLLARFESGAQQLPSQQYVVARTKRERKLEQPALVEVAIEEELGGLEQSLERCLRTLGKQAKKKNAQPFDQFARKALRSVGQEMFDRAGMRNPTTGQLHELRIAGKRLRYSIELFHSAFSSELRDDVYPLVEEIQSRLGQLNDHATAQTMFQHWLADLPPNENAAHLAEQILNEYNSAVQLRTEFLSWWSSQPIAELQREVSELLDD